MTSPAIKNIDTREKAKFDALASSWWDTDGPFKTLHDINPIRLQYIKRHASLAGKNVLDIGCGGGILSEVLAKEGASVTGLDISEPLLNIARLHSQQSNLDICYCNATAEEYALKSNHAFDVITCMELLEHVPNPQSIIKACAVLLKPGGQAFFSTINRTLKAYLYAVLGAEHLLHLLPVGTHDYSRFIRPSEIDSWCQKNGLRITDLAGISYLPFINRFTINKNPDVNYLIHCQRKT